MTFLERAEKIVGPNIDGNKYHDAKIKLIANQISEACAEAYAEGIQEDCCYAEGFAAAREQAITYIKQRIQRPGTGNLADELALFLAQEDCGCKGPGLPHQHQSESVKDRIAAMTPDDAGKK